MGKFKPGDKRPPGAGMKKGQKSLKTQAWDRLGEYIINEGAERYLKNLHNMKDKEFNYEFKSVMEFFKPKLQRAEVKQETTFNGLTPMPRIYIGFSEKEEAELRRADELDTEIPGSMPMPKIHINRRDNEEETEKRGRKVQYRNSDGTIHAKE
jgi:hypothetical protein